MFKTLKYGWIVFKYSWEANGFLAILSVISNIYDKTIFPFLQIFLLAQVLNLLQKKNPLQISDLIPYALFYVLFAAINALLVEYINIQQFSIDSRFEAYLNKIIINKLTTLDPATFEKPSFQELLAQIDGISVTMGSQLERITWIIAAVAKVLTAIFVLLPMFPVFIPLILISVIPYYYFKDLSRKKMWPFFTNKRSVVLRVTQYVKNLLSQDSTSKEAAIFNTGSVLKEKVLAEQKIYFKNYDKSNNPFIPKVLLSNLFQLGVFTYTQYLNLIAVLKGTLGIGTFSLAFQQALNLESGSVGILDLYSSIASRIQTLDKFFTFMKYEPVIISPVSPIELPQNPTPPVIEFKNVSFRYPKTERFILKDFNVKIESGEKIALVGENGAGKTTIIKLLLRFYDATEGEILINNVNIKDLSLEQWHKMVGALFQDFIKYQFTFKENVTFGNLEEKDKEEALRDAIFKSGADKYLDDLPSGVDQVVGKMFDTGIDLSGGQWQKLALARAFFRNAPLLILDEPTSAIDAKAEYEIFENVQKLQKDKTVIIISHRFSTVRNADRILVLDEGKIIEEGNHEKLMTKKGLYAELFNLQAEGYK
jgi:ATP-binding cassette subfamily B protein